MNIETLAGTTLGRLLIRALGTMMESRFSYRFFGPTSVITGADVHPGDVVLEIGCGTGYFTLPLAQVIGDQGMLVAMDILPESVALVSRKVQSANVNNVQVVKSDALNTGLDAERFDMILLFGVIPAPMLPLSRLLPEMHRLLKPGGRMAVWPPVPLWLPGSIVKHGSFTLTGKQNGVYNFERC